MRFNTDSDLSDHEKDSFSKGNNIIITTPKASGQKIKEKRQLLIIKQLAFIVPLKDEILNLWNDFLAIVDFIQANPEITKIIVNL